MSKVRAKDGQKGSGREPTDEPADDSPAPSPLDFALRVMQDETQPMALRVSAAKLAASLMPKPAAQDAPAGDEPDAAAEEPMSDLEIARRIAHILMLHDNPELAEQDRQMHKNRGKS